MWFFEYSKETKASPSAVWQLWADVKNWKIWDKDVLESSLEGTVEIGTKGILKPTSGPKANFVLTEVEENRKFVNQMKLPLASIDFIHQMVKRSDSVVVIHRIEIKGLLAPLVGATLGQQLKAGVPSAVENLVRLAEKENE